ncbi:heat stress transcription factor A-6b-like [Brassica napus]|uniref:heat stress transcription factor A-6b-like n=1 Tax=Brassica napus TaxID=3708 RepID=UPI002078ABA6|nr:heat stress transcription factor A-6b-like [Brassica napus]
MAEEEIRESVSKAKEEDLGLSRAIPSNQDGECDENFLEIVLDVVDVLGLFPRQPPSAPAIPSARRRVAGKKIEIRSTNDLQLLGMKDRPDFPVPVILDRIYKLVDDPSPDSIISWSKSNKGFVIRNQEKLIRRKIYKRFFCSSFKTFISMLKHYGFSKIKRSDGLREFGNENFVRGQPMLMKEMHIKTVMKRVNKDLKPRC